MHAEVCEHFGGAVVLGPNWIIGFDAAADGTRIASSLSGYLFVADCAGGSVESLCERAAYSGTRVRVYVGAEGVAVDPETVEAGPVLLCYGAREPGRIALSLFSLESDVDPGTIDATRPITGAAVQGQTGAVFLGGLTATLDQGMWSEETQDLAPGRYLLHGGVVEAGASDPVVPEGVEGRIAILTVVP